MEIKWPSAMVVAREVDDDALAAQALQLPGRGLAMVPIEAPASGQGKAEPDRHRGKCPTENTEASVSLANVVEQGGSNDIALTATRDGHQSGIEPVSLVWIRL